jgi:4a-hydroxytetrahydrobiopterin dehydratase
MAAACVPGGKCLPCESLDKSHLLNPQQIESELASMKLWKLSEDNTKLIRAYTARNFQAAMDSLDSIAKIAERESHHPDLHLTGYRNVEIVLFTHSLGGISLNDIALAKMIDEEVSVDYSPKWLKEHPEGKRE